MAKPTNEERAQQLVLRITQLHSFLQVSQLVKTARFGQQYVFPDAQAIDRAEAFVTADLLAKLFSLFDPNGTDLRAFSAEDPNLAEEIASMTLDLNQAMFFSRAREFLKSPGVLGVVDRTPNHRKGFSDAAEDTTFPRQREEEDREAPRTDGGWHVAPCGR